MVSMNKTLLICPWFGDLPPWYDKYLENIKPLKAMGYDFLMERNLESFKKRVFRRLDIECPIVPGTGKVHDYRAVLGYLYNEELKDYNWWGHTDFDCVYGRVDNYMTDEFLRGIDVYSNHPNYICGPWTLYRNSFEVNNVFREYPGWEKKLIYPETNGWVEQDFTREVNANLRIKYKLLHTYEVTDIVKMEDGKLMVNGKETMMHHFRRTKVWPLQ